MENNSIKKSLSSGGLQLLFGLCLVLVAIVLVILLFLNGNTTIENADSDVTSTTALSCDSSKVVYPFFSYDNSKKKELKINVLFVNNKIDSISLIYNLYYGTQEEIAKSETLNHAEMNQSFVAKSLGPDAFGANYSKLNDSMQMTLNAEGRELNELSGKFFLLEKAGSSYDKDSLSKLYNSKGLNCTIRN